MVLPTESKRRGSLLSRALSLATPLASLGLMAEDHLTPSRSLPLNSLDCRVTALRVTRSFQAVTSSVA
jgi:hypothetical protein